MQTPWIQHVNLICQFIKNFKILCKVDNICNTLEYR